MIVELMCVCVCVCVWWSRHQTSILKAMVISCQKESKPHSFILEVELENKRQGHASCSRLRFKRNCGCRKIKHQSKGATQINIWFFSVARSSSNEAFSLAGCLTLLIVTEWGLWSRATAFPHLEEPAGSGIRPCCSFIYSCAILRESLRWIEKLAVG